MGNKNGALFEVEYADKGHLDGFPTIYSTLKLKTHILYPIFHVLQTIPTSDAMYGGSNMQQGGNF